LLPSSSVVPPSEGDAAVVPDAPDAAASPPLDALPLLMTPLVAPLETLPDELPLAEAPLAVAAPVLPPEPEELTEPDEPDDVPTEPEVVPPPLPEDPEPTVTEGVFELEHAKLVVTPTQNNPKRHPANMETSVTQLADEGRGRPPRPPNKRIKYQARERVR